MGVCRFRYLLQLTNEMNLKELVVCKFAGCNRVYTDPRILPCGKRTCAAHIDAMLVKNDDLTSSSRKMIKCHFCEKIHNFPDDGGEFLADDHIPHLLSISYSTEHQAAKKSFNELTQLLDALTKIDKRSYVIDYFERVEADILLEKEFNIQKLVDYYQTLVDRVRERKDECLRRLNTNNTALESELEAIKKTLKDHESQLNKDKLDFVLKTLDGDEAKWKDIQCECNTLCEKMRSLAEELKKKIVGEQVIDFRPSTSGSNTQQLESICGTLSVAIDSQIVNSDKMKSDLVNLCNLRGKQFKLLYRASRDGFAAASFHAKCDNQPNTLTVIRTTRGYIFGAFAAVAWDRTSGPKADPNAFIFSLVNAHSSPLLIPIKAGDKNAVVCIGDFGPTFGSGFDIHVSDESSSNKESCSNLGKSYAFAHESVNCRIDETELFLAGSRSFQTSDIEVFVCN